MKEFIRFFQIFYRLKGLTLFYLLLLMGAAGVFDALGVTMFLPILEGSDPDSSIGQAISSIFEFFYLEYSFTKVLLLMVLFFFLRSLFLILKDCYIGKITAELLETLRNQITEQLFEADYLYFIQQEPGYINNAVTIEVQGIAFAFKMFANVLFTIIFTLIYLVLPFLLNPLITIVVLIVGTPIVPFIRTINLNTKDYSIQQSAQSARLQEFLIQSLQNFKYLKSTASQSNILAKITEATQKLGHIQFRLAILQALSSSVFVPFVILIVALLLFYQVEIVGGEMAEFVFLLYLLKRAMDQILGVQQKYRKFLSSVGSIQVFQKLEKELSAQKEEVNQGGAIPDFEQQIEFNGVSFRYGNGSEVLSEINLVIPPRSTVAFVGASGSGKSTLVTLLTGILQPSKGDILLGGKRYREMDQTLLRRGIGYVTQESVIFNDSIRNNITLWHENGSQAKVQATATKAYISDFIEGLPEQYNTLLGNNGINISGGQRQRITIARELFKEAKLLIFDEATSALDTESEREVQKNIDHFKGEKTVVLIAHRLSTVKNCDLIFVLKDGKIMEQGSYEQLLSLNGEFRRMVGLQTALTQE